MGGGGGGRERERRRGGCGFDFGLRLTCPYLIVNSTNKVCWQQKVSEEPLRPNERNKIEKPNKLQSQYDQINTLRSSKAEREREREREI